MVTSLGNPRVKQVIRWRDKTGARREDRVFLAEGFKMFEEAPPEMIREVYVTEEALSRLHEMAEQYHTVSGYAADPGEQHAVLGGYVSDQSKQHDILDGYLAELNRQHDILDGNAADSGKWYGVGGGYLTGVDKLRQVGYEVVSADVFAKMSDTKTPQGILMVLTQPRYSLDEILGVDRPLLLILEELQDPGNLGTIFRTGEGAGVSGILMSAGTADVFAPKVIRATMGSVYRVPFVYLEDWERDIFKMKAAGVRLYAAHLEGKGTYWGRKYQDGTAFLIGNEGKGLREHTAALADELVRIPMGGQLESLNAAMAAGLLLYEARRVRQNLEM
jgi:TrmH family RNA methyltransferase